MINGDLKQTKKKKFLGLKLRAARNTPVAAGRGEDGRQLLSVDAYA